MILYLDLVPENSDCYKWYFYYLPDTNSNYVLYLLTLSYISVILVYNYIINIC